MGTIDRRRFVGATLAAGTALATGAVAAQAGAAGSPGFAAAGSWSSLAAGFRVPAWFRDAKFGIWGHWGPQCQPEFGDWYGRLMYVEGNPFYEHHLANYGHPSKTGFLDVIGQWRGESWDPDYLLRRYKAAGAKYFMGMACHHDNFDLYASEHHAWNATRVGPKRDIVAGWERATREAGLRFGLSNHASHAWHWWQTGYGYDTQGPRKGARYDAHWLRSEHGRGTWWDGLDPQELYVGGSFVPPDGIATPERMQDWHDTHDGRWMEFAPHHSPGFAANWLARQKQLVERYRPDMVYFDDENLPLGMTGQEALAHFYAQGTGSDGLEIVATGKKLSPSSRRILVEDVERGFSDAMRAEPWQTCTCIGDWHYNRSRFLQKSYVPAEQVIQRLADVVSKNGNLLLSIPVRGDGTIDAEEERILDGITAWMQVNGADAIHGTRPWRRYGEGPTQVSAGSMNEGKAGGFTADDVRFTTKDGALYVIFMKWPQAPVRLASLGLGATDGARIERAGLLGGGKVAMRQDADALTLTLPFREGGVAPVVRLEGRGLV